MSKTEQVHALEIEEPLVQVSSVCRPAARILAVDYEPAACKLLSLIFAPPAFYWTPARNGEEALAYLNRGHFDAVISDLHMPGIHGLGLPTEVHHLHPHIAFLVVTGVNEVDAAVQAMRIGLGAVSAGRKSTSLPLTMVRIARLFIYSGGRRGSISALPSRPKSSRSLFTNGTIVAAAMNFPAPKKFTSLNNLTPSPRKGRTWR